MHFRYFAQLQKTFFTIWLICLVIFAFLILTEQQNQSPWDEAYKTNVLLASILIGIATFLLTWLMGIFMEFKKITHFPFGRMSILIAFIWLFGLTFYLSSSQPSLVSTPESQLKSETSNVENVAPTATMSPKVENVKVAKPIDPYANDPNLKNAEWGEAVKTDSGSYTMKVGMDTKMSTADELYQALLTYRQTKGKSNLTWDGRLAEYASSRASFICAHGTDHHAGFKDFLENQDGYKKLGYRHLGENMSVGMKLTGTHLIEWIYAKSPGHDANQLGDWSHVGVGISGNCSTLIFGNQKI